jgi:DNA-binding response OmpR family regulator
MSGTPWSVTPKDYDDILLKPFMIEELVDAVHRLVPGTTGRTLDA